MPTFKNFTRRHRSKKVINNWERLFLMGNLLFFLNLEIYFFLRDNKASWLFITYFIRYHAVSLSCCNMENIIDNNSWKEKLRFKSSVYKFKCRVIKFVNLGVIIGNIIAAIILHACQFARKFVSAQAPLLMITSLGF